MGTKWRLLQNSEITEYWNNKTATTTKRRNTKRRNTKWRLLQNGDYYKTAKLQNIEITKRRLQQNGDYNKTAKYKTAKYKMATTTKRRNTKWRLLQNGDYYKTVKLNNSEITKRRLLQNGANNIGTGRFLLCKVVSSSNPCCWLVRRYFGKTLRWIFEIWSMNKVIQEIIFGIKVFPSVLFGPYWNDRFSFQLFFLYI